ncbi:hypothetical protein Ancab_007001 [Ancistrocladus abbreviatus]
MVILLGNSLFLQLGHDNWKQMNEQIRVKDALGKIIPEKTEEIKGDLLVWGEVDLKQQTHETCRVRETACSVAPLINA